MASFASIPIISSICFITPSVLEAGKSILLSTGIISWLFEIAWYEFAKVCASTPCVLSTTSIEPSQAARERFTS